MAINSSDTQTVLSTKGHAEENAGFYFQLQNNFFLLKFLKNLLVYHCIQPLELPDHQLELNSV